MNETIKQQNDFTGVTAWHDAGWTGKGINVWDREGMSEHGQGTHRRVLEAAPDATVINATHNMSINKGVIIKDAVQDGSIMLSADAFIKAHNINIITCSLGGKGNREKAMVDLFGGLRRKYNLTMFNSAGNDGSDGVKGGSLPESEAMYVGACMAFKNNYNDLRMWHYSSIGDEEDEVDFSTFTGGLNGTSFSCPYLAGMTALLMQRYGTDMTSAEVCQFYKMIARPIDTGHPVKDGYDLWSGYGVPILPDPKRKLVRMTIGSKFYKVDGKVETMDTAPSIYQQRTFVPIAFVALALGADVRWNPKNWHGAKEVIISKGGRIVSMEIGNTIYMVNGKPYTMDTAPFIKDQRTQVPISFVSLALGCKVAWVEKEKKVLILE